MLKTKNDKIVVLVNFLLFWTKLSFCDFWQICRFFLISDKIVVNSDKIVVKNDKIVVNSDSSVVEIDKYINR